MEQYRPVFHYTAQTHIINDPNGLVYLNGEYHLMYQHNVDEQVHWGHAVSRDLLHWQRLPNALAPDAHGQIWSGSAVVDEAGTSGLQTGTTPVLVALFTYSAHGTGKQSQGLAYSNDAGRTWEKYAGNPVLESSRPDFRDPKVFWFAPAGEWRMVLACGGHVEFYASKNLVDWRFQSRFGEGEGSHGGVWECPDLFELPLPGGETRWVLAVSVNGGGPAGGTGMQYFVGRYNGERFTSENTPGTVLWMDWGKDFYAGVTWNNLPAADGRRLMIAWADNWQYRDDLPTSPFWGQQSCVRELSLYKGPEGVRLRQAPAAEYGRLFHRPLPQGATATALRLGCRIDAGMDAEIRLTAGGGDVFIRYTAGKHILTLDRTGAAHNVPNLYFSAVCHAPVQPDGGKFSLLLLADTSLVEVFADGGKAVLTCLAFPDTPGWRVSLAPAAAFAAVETAGLDENDALIR